MNNSTIIEEAKETFKEHPRNIKQEKCTISRYNFKDNLKKYKLKFCSQI